MPLTQPTIDAFLSEVEHVAEAIPGYRRVAGILLDNDVPTYRANKTTTRKHIQRAIGRVEKSTWSHPQVAIRKGEMDLKRLGFKPTKLGIPLPGEKWLTKSYRSGTLHAHDSGPVYLIHDDKHPVKGLGILKHTIDDLPAALYKRIMGTAKLPVLPGKTRKGGKHGF